MAQRAHVPKFGNWEGEDDVPYTVYFDKARKGRSDGKIINPNVPQENPDMFNPQPAQAQARPARTETKPEEPIECGPVLRPAQERPVSSRENDNHRRFNETAPPRNDNVGRRATVESTNQQNGSHGSGSGPGRPGRNNAGLDRSFDKSPLHPQNRVKMMGKEGGGSPAQEGNNSYDSSHNTHGKSRLKPGARGDDSADRGTAVPRFGLWGKDDPSTDPSAEEYTGIFDNLRQERRAGPSSAKNTPNSYNQMPRQNSYNNHKGCCCPWWRK